MILFFGDSFTSGENTISDCSFVDFIQTSDSCINVGISGTTMGDYSIYPVGQNSLLDRITKNKTSVKKADTIFLEYGINDVSAIMAGFVSEKVVMVSFVKAVDLIKQINPDAKIIFLSISDRDKVIMDTAKLHCNYLSNIYFHDFEFEIPFRLWYNNYKTLIDKIMKHCKVVPMITQDDFYDNYLSDDNIHPTVEGHKIIAENIKAKM